MEKGGDKISAADYKRIQDYIYVNLGIDVGERKKETVTTKIMKLTHRRGMAKPQDYINFILNTSNPDGIQEF